MRSEYPNPYRLFFPLGILSAVLGITLWFLFQYRLLDFYPRFSHANLMFMGFLWAFITGFLMTAVPKMFSVVCANLVETVVPALLIALQIVLNFFNLTELSVYLFGLQILMLGAFLVRRILIKKQIPFEGFYFLPFAFVQGFIGVIGFMAEPNYSQVYLLSGQALVLNLILGLGSRLIPVISRCPNALTPDIPTLSKNRAFILSLAILLNGGFLIEAFYNAQMGSVIKLVSVMIMSFCLLDLHKKPTAFGYAGYGLKISIVLLLLHSVIEAFWSVTIANAHILYIGVFILVTLLVASRVMLAHGKQNLGYERDSKRLLAVILLLLLATLFRVLADVYITGNLMKISVLLATIAIVLWGHKFVKVLKVSK